MDFVSVPVPSDLVVDVMAFIAKRQSELRVVHDSESNVGPAEASTEWTEGSLLQLWSDSEAPMRIVLVLLARKAGQPVSGDEIAGVLDKDERGHTVAGMMGALGRRLKHRHGGRWPFVKAWNALNGQWEYSMPPAVAAMLSAITRATPEVVAVSGQQPGYFCFIRDPAGRRCRITSVKNSEAEALEAATRWLAEAVAEAPPSGRNQAYRWVSDPAGNKDMHVCVEIGSPVSTAKPLLR